MSRALSIYHRLPYPGRVAIASARGAQLWWWRYRGDSDELVAAALDADRGDPEVAAARQADVLARSLGQIARTVPYYRDLWAQRRRAGDRADVEDLSAWPVLDKTRVKQDPKAFLPDGFRPERMFTEHTSGTTGLPLTLWWTRTAARSWYALFEARSRQWHGVDRREPWAIVGGQPVVPAERDQAPYWVWNRALHQLYLSSYHISARSAADYARALDQHEVTHVVGYPSALAALAGVMTMADVRPRPVRVVLTNAESLLAHQRRLISDVFGAPVRDTFGQAEIVAAGSECPSGTLHGWPEVGVTEALDAHDAPVTSGSGRLVATGLLNDGMPLVRYDTGDLIEPADDAPPCECGRTLPPMGRVSGRADDVVVTPDGRHVGRLDPVFKADLPILEAQIRQDRADGVDVLLVPLPGWDHHSRDLLTDRLRERLGDMTVDIHEVERVPRGANGKFRAVISTVSGPTTGPTTGSTTASPTGQDHP